MPTYSVAEGENPYEVEIALVDDLKPGDVAVFGCGGPTDRIAPWGELLSTASRARGAAGCVTDGLVRDVRQIRAMEFPVFHGGIGPLDSRGRGKMMAMDVPTECGGVLVERGDLVFGDVDGVVVIPQDIAGEVDRRGAREGQRREQDARPSRRGHAPRRCLCPLWDPLRAGGALRSTGAQGETSTRRREHHDHRQA